MVRRVSFGLFLFGWSAMASAQTRHLSSRFAVADDFDLRTRAGLGEMGIMAADAEESPLAVGLKAASAYDTEQDLLGSRLNVSGAYELTDRWAMSLDLEGTGSSLNESTRVYGYAVEASASYAWPDALGVALAPFVEGDENSAIAGAYASVSYTTLSKVDLELAAGPEADLEAKDLGYGAYLYAGYRTAPGLTPSLLVLANDNTLGAEPDVGVRADLTWEFLKRYTVGVNLFTPVSESSSPSIGASLAAKL